MEGKVGEKVLCFRKQTNEWQECEICFVLEDEKSISYYVHYMNIDRRWDEWVSPDSIDFRRHHDKKDEDDDNPEYYGKVRRVEKLIFSDFLMQIWYFSPLPETFDKLTARINGEVFSEEDRDSIYCCEFCMNFFRTNKEYMRHCQECRATHPPGDEIYRDGRISAYEVDGLYARDYCTNLCLVIKMFLWHKWEYYDTSMFYFYIVCRNDARGAHPLGLFSKEKDMKGGNNLACFLAFPCYQKMGIGRWLILLSYEFSKIERRVGSPEKPLSDLGNLTYQACWREILINCFVEHKDEMLTISAISTYTGMTEEDVMNAVQSCGFVKKIGGEYVFAVTKRQIEQCRERARKKPLQFDTRYLRWTPYPEEPKFRLDNTR